MSQVQAAKLSSHIAFIPPADAVTVTRMSVYVWLEPGDDSGETQPRQGSVYAQTLRRT